jgi:hypothetical protein
MSNYNQLYQMRIENLANSLAMEYAIKNKMGRHKDEIVDWAINNSAEFEEKAKSIIDEND